jgi:hypothetical protein
MAPMRTNEHYEELLKKLDQFSRKYYTNKLLRGLMISAAIVFAAFILVNILEYYLWFSSTIRTILFYAFITCSGISFITLVLMPLLKIARIGKVLTNDEAAQIIGRHFSEVKDKLLNILQLQHQLNTTEDNSLLLASIDQKAKEIKPVSFPKAVDYSTNKRFLKYLLPPICLFVFILFAAPSVFREGSKRLLFHDEFFEKEMPFQIKITNTSLRVMQYENFKLRIEVSGKSLPAEVSIALNGVTYKMVAASKTSYEYEFVNVQKSEVFHFEAAGFRTKDYQLEVLPKPVINDFSLRLEYPAYVAKATETIKNTGDITVPQHTRVSWLFNTKFAESVKLKIGDSLFTADRTSSDVFSFSQRFDKSTSYQIMVSGKENKTPDTVSYFIQVIADEYPTISVDEFKDSNNVNLTYFSGSATDDYALSKLVFVNDIIREDSAGSPLHQRISIPFLPGSKFAAFTHMFDLKQLQVKPGDRLTYYFEVSDNTGKSARTAVKNYNVPTVSERDKQTEKANDEIKEELNKSIKDAMELNKEVKKLQENMIDKKNASWEDKKALQDLIEKQKQLQENVQKLDDKLKKNNEQQSDYKELNPEIKEKQDQLEKLMDQVLSEEMKDMIKKMEEMMDKMNKQDAMKQLDDMKMNDKKLEKELDRMLDLFKKLEQEQKLKEATDKLDKLAEEQEKLSKQTEQKGADNKEMKEQQDKLNEKMEKLQQEMKEAEKMNEEMQEKTDLEKPKEEMNHAAEDMKQASDQLNKNSKKDAAQKQKEAADKMKQAAESMRSMMSSKESEENEEDMESLRHLMKNLVHLSFDQEDLMNDFQNTDINNPKYVDLIKRQNKIHEDSKMVEDSLYALSKRVIQLEATITKEITNVNDHIEKAVGDLEDRRVPMASVHQQYVMTGYNNLALMLSEAFDQMQQQQKQQQQQKPGNGTCKKPGGKGQKPSLPQLNKMQQQLNQQMQQMQDMMKNGLKPGDKGYSQKVAEMAKQQAAIRQALQEINKEENGNGKLGDMQKAMEQMNQTETDLVNKRFTEEMLKRQQEITVRLLDFEKAQKEKGQEEKREAKTADDIKKVLPPSLDEYLKKRQSEIDLYKTVPPSLKPFYKQLVEDYFKHLKN